MHELVAANVADFRETLLSMIRGGAVKIGGDADVRELVAATVAEALETLLVAAVEEEAQRKKAQREKAQREWWRQGEELIAAGVLAEPELWVTLSSEAQELIAAGALADPELWVTLSEA